MRIFLSEIESAVLWNDCRCGVAHDSSRENALMRLDWTGMIPMSDSSYELIGNKSKVFRIRNVWKI